MQWNGASCCEFDFRSMESETTTWSEFRNGRKAIVEQIIASKERDKSKRAGLWELQYGNHLSKVVWDRKIKIEFTRLIMIERTSSMLDKVE